MVIKSEMSGKYGINTFLCGSILHSNGTCSGANSIPCYGNKLYPADEPIGQILQLRGTLTISKVAALAVLEDKTIIVSQFSTEFAINSKESATHINEYGTFITIGPLNLQKYELVIIATSTILEPKEHDNPPIFSFDLQFQSGKRRVGLIGGDQFLVNRDLCYTTQFYNFHICNNSSNLELFSESSVEIIENLASSSIILIQPRIDTTISKMVAELCRLQQLMIRRASRDFEQHGADMIMPEREGKGILSTKFGEIGKLTICERKLIQAFNEKGNLCCHNLPIRYVNNNEYEKQQLYLMPLSRRIVTDCNPVKCSAVMQIAHFNLYNEAICQTLTGLMKCDHKFFKPSSNLTQLRFDPLKLSEYDDEQFTPENQHVITTRLLSKQNEGSRFLEKVTMNSIRCQGDFNCEDTAYMNSNFNLEMSRAVNPLFEWVHKRTSEGFALFLVFLWISWCLLYAIYNFVKLLCTKFGQMNGSESCFGFIAVIFINLNQTFNPFVKSKERATYDVRLNENLMQIQEKLTDISNVLDWYREQLRVHNLRIKSMEEKYSLLSPNQMQYPKVPPCPNYDAPLPTLTTTPKTHKRSVSKLLPRQPGATIEQEDKSQRKTLKEIIPLLDTTEHSSSDEDSYWDMKTKK
jgi:hypothetical protein